MASLPTRVPIPANGVDYRNKIVLAPMVRSGELPSRLLALKYGADLVWGPETIDKALIGTTRAVNPRTKTVDFTRVSSNGLKNPVLSLDQRESLIYRLHPAREGKKLIYQIGTSNPVTAVAAAKLIAGDVAGIDVNAGCPKPFSTSGGMGAALLKTPETLCSILRALVAEVGEPFKIGVSVKIRLLETPEETETLVRSLCATGITGLTIHCRTTPMRPRQRAIREQLRMIGQVCKENGVACLMNGDVTSRTDGLASAEEYGVNGAMIATAAETNPSCFREEGVLPWQEVVKEYVKTSLEVENRFGNTKYLLGQMVPGKVPEYKRMMAAKSFTELVQSLGYDTEETFVQMAKGVDELLELGTFAKPVLSKAEKKRLNKEAAVLDVDKARTKQEADGPGDSNARKRTAEVAELDMPHDALREMGPGSLNGQASVLAV
ncbi:hypothetical protein B0A48_16086 [Cryoendolithus antarcticus]|uniref:DUS-like FMN-binding domain-containing protein n=1 Tax=Cryoendolithus antarcticus TaxID=1507870 RepID=A0A1V8SF50_9PEZI|nr:hypothetical protein B0A48_16086 [Cryoendolithus antarcticus]